jgi:glycosyltransferase involved in cell wall biosynthesis
MPDIAQAARRLAEHGGILLTMHSLSQGGGDRVGVLLANGFARAGIPTRIALMRDSGDGGLESLLDPAVSVVSGGPPMGLSVRRKGPALGHRHLERFRGLKLIRRQIDEFKPAVVLATTDNMAFVTALARRPKDSGRLFAMKLTNRLSRPNIGPFRSFYRRKLFNFIFDRLDLVLTLSEGERRFVLSVHPGREGLLRTAANPYVTDEMKPGGAARGADAPRLLAAGRMVAQKRFDNLLRAFALSAREDATLTILGDGPLRSGLEHLAQSLGIADRVAMPGYVPNVVEWLGRSDLFVLSSDYEGLPAVIVEALACNVPVVTTESFFAARDLLGSAQSCAVVPIGDPQALAQAIDRCLAPAAPSNLSKLAEPYLIQPAIDAHIVTLAEALHERESRERT